MTTHQHHPVSRTELLELVANPEIPLADIDTSQVADFPSTEQVRLMHEVILALRNFDTEQLQEMVALVNHIASSAASEAADTATADEPESVTTPSMATSEAEDTASQETAEAEADATPATAALAETGTAAADADAQLESSAPEQETATAEPTLEWNFDTATDLEATSTSSFQDLFGMASADPATAAPAPTSGLNVFDEMLAQQEREQFLAPMQNAVSQNDSIVWDLQEDSPLVFDTDSTAMLDLTSSAATDIPEIENEASQASADSLGSNWETSTPETAPTPLEDENETTFNAEWLSLFGGGETGATSQEASPAPANTLALNPEVAHPASATDSSLSSAPAVTTSDGWNFDSDSAEQETTSSNSDPFALSTNETSWDFSGVWGDIPAWDEPVNPQSIITPTESVGDAQQDTAPSVADIAALFDDGDVAASEISSTIPGLLGSDDDGTSTFLGHLDNSTSATTRDSADAAKRSEIASSPFFATPATPTPSTPANDNGFAFNNEIFSWDGENDSGWGSQPDPLSILGSNADDAASQSTLRESSPSLGVTELFGEIDWGVDVATPEATPAPALDTPTATPTQIVTSVADTLTTDTPAPTSLFATSDAEDLWGGFTLDSNSADEATADTAPTRDADGAASNDSSAAPSLNSSLTSDEASSAPSDVNAPAGATTSPVESPVDGAEGADVAETPSVATSSATNSASTATTPELNFAATTLELVPADSSFPADPFGLLGGDNSASSSADNSSNAYGTPSLTGSELYSSLNEEPTSSSSATVATPAVATTPAREPAANPWSLLDTLGSFDGAASAPTATTPVAPAAVPATTQEAADSATYTTPALEPASNPWNLLADVLGDYKPSTPARTEQEATSTASANSPRQDELGTGVAEPTGLFGAPSMREASNWAAVASDALVTNDVAGVNDEFASTSAAAALDPEADLAFDTVGEALAYLSTARRTEAGKYRPHSVQELRILLTDKEISLGDLDLSRLKSLHGAFANIPSERGKIPPMLVADIEEQQTQILIQDSAYPLPLVYDLTPNWTGIESLDFSHITDLSYCFAYQFGFNNGLTTWKVDHVTSLRGMFRGCINFRSNLNHWNTARVQDMSGVFALCFHYNQPVTWNTSACTTMRAMFFSCPHFNQPVCFDTGAVTDMGQMFMNCMSFNQELNFITTQVTDMSQMLAGCRKFNSSVSLDTTLVQNFQGMFANCSSFDQEVKFSTASATNMAEMFANCSSFTGTNFRFSGTRNVKDMTRMFAGCGKFAGNLMLSTNAVEQATEMFAGCRIPDGNRFTLSQPLPEGQELGIDEQHLNFLTHN